MHFAANLQYLRRQNGNMTQEKLAGQVGVSRQTVSKWESGESIPDVETLISLCQVFSCSLDRLLRENMVQPVGVQAVSIRQIRGFHYVWYTVISKNARIDALDYLRTKAAHAGLLHEKATFIGWGFPHVSHEQKNRFGLSGYTAALVLPQSPGKAPDGMDIGWQEDTCYAVTTIRDPFNAPQDQVSRAYGLILEYLSANGIKKMHKSGILPCFERLYRHDGILCMDVYVHCQGGANTDKLTSLI